YLAWAFFEQGNLAGALEELGTTLGLDRGLGDAHWLKARIDVRTGAVRDAIPEAEEALRLNPSRHEAYATIGDAYEQLGRRGDAVRAYEDAVARRPGNGEWWYRLGRLRLDANKRDEAL